MQKSIRNRISELILCGEMKPGDRLEEQALAERFQVSRTPIREAIQQLSSSGLVQLRPRRSAIVRRMSEAELSEAFEAMGDIEGLCASYAAQRLNEAGRLRLKALMKISKQACDEGNGPEAQEIDNEFHDIIHGAARNWMITSIARETRMKVSPYSAIGFIFDSEIIDLRIPHEQHSRIAEAILDGDATAARSLMIEHVGQNYLTLQKLLPVAEERGGAPLFADKED
ncbi:GntR family transcriptional regulator [Sulfitobacter sp. HNIBRBA3233]|uniref:GntR family transcriptional regulator n=1 Tax=Sulfitobacter marinivivus TaxID=3158558 RepID=UPI0032DF8C3E